MYETSLSSHKPSKHLRTCIICFNSDIWGRHLVPAWCSTGGLVTSLYIYSVLHHQNQFSMEQRYDFMHIYWCIHSRMQQIVNPFMYKLLRHRTCNEQTCITICLRIFVFLVLTGFPTRNRYIVYNSMGQQVFFMGEGKSERVSALSNVSCIFAVRLYENNKQQLMDKS